MTKVILEFPTEEHAEKFCAYWADGGGEYNYFDVSEMHDTNPIISCDYSRCFPALGYKPKKHGKRKIRFLT